MLYSPFLRFAFTSIAPSAGAKSREPTVEQVLSVGENRAKSFVFRRVCGEIRVWSSGLRTFCVRDARIRKAAASLRCLAARPTGLAVFRFRWSPLPVVWILKWASLLLVKMSPKDRKRRKLPQAPLELYAGDPIRLLKSMTE